MSTTGIFFYNPLQFCFYRFHCIFLQYQIATINPFWHSFSIFYLLFYETYTAIGQLNFTLPTYYCAYLCQYFFPYKLAFKRPKISLVNSMELPTIVHKNIASSDIFHEKPYIRFKDLCTCSSVLIKKGKLTKFKLKHSDAEDVKCTYTF